MIPSRLSQPNSIALQQAAPVVRTLVSSDAPGRRGARVCAVAAFIFFASIACCFSEEQSDRPPEAKFELHRNLISIEVRLKGKGPLTMMLDTGTNPPALDVATARELGIAVRATGKNAVGGGTGENELFELDPLDIAAGGLNAEGVEFAAADLSAISKALGKVLHGVLGHSFLKDRVVRIDYPNGVVSFLGAPGEKSSRADAVATLPFNYEHDSILVRDVSVNGRPVTTLFDTGFNGSFNVMPAAIGATRAGR
jgi:hypothetical protein